MEAASTKSPPTGLLRIPTHVVIHRSQGTSRELAECRTSGAYAPGPSGAVCELVAGGVTIATGKLIRRRGSWHMLVQQTGGNT